MKGKQIDSVPVLTQHMYKYRLCNDPTMHWIRLVTNRYEMIFECTLFVAMLHVTTNWTPICLQPMCNSQELCSDRSVSLNGMNPLPSEQTEATLGIMGLLSDQQTLLLTENYLQLQKWSPYKGRGAVLC